MAIEDLRHAPLVSYHDLVRERRMDNDALTFSSQKCQRQQVFVTALLDYLCEYPEITAECRTYMIESIRKFLSNEVTLSRQQLDKVRSLTDG